jgi:hypothetical protein
MEKATTGRQTAEHKPASSPRPCQNSQTMVCECDLAVNRSLCLPVQRLNAFAIASMCDVVRYRSRHASQLVSPFVLSRQLTPGIDVVLGGGWRTLGTQTRRESLTCDGLGMQLFVSNSLNTSVVLLQYLPVLLYLIKLSQSRRRPSPTHFWPACRDCVCLSCTPRSMELIVCLCTAVLHGLGCCCPFSHVAGMEAWEVELSE